MAVSQKWMDAVRKNKTRVKLWSVKTTFAIPGGWKGNSSVIGILNMRIAIRPYGAKWVSTGIECPKGCISGGRIIVPEGDLLLKKIKEECDELELTVLRIFTLMKTKTTCPTPREVAEKLKEENTQVVVASSFDDCVKEFRESKEKDWTESTMGFLDNMLAALKRFMEKELHVEQVVLHEMNTKFLTRFQLWMARCGEKTGKGLAPSSVYQYILKLTQVLEFAYINDYITVNPCDKFEITHLKGEDAPDMLDRKISLPNQHKLESTTIVHDERLEHGRLLMLLQSWTGFSYEDLCQYNIKACIYTNLLGQKEIRYNRTKTGELGLIPYFPETQALLEKLEFQNHPGNYRTYLRLVEAVFAYFEIPMADQDGTHTLRHLFGNRMLERGFTMESVSRMMGHKSTEVTESIYARVNSEKIQSDYAYVKKREAI
jgi:integrase